MRPALIISALILAQFTAADGIASIFAMLPTIYREFPSQPGAVGWLVTTFFLVAATTSAIVGRLADVLGRKAVAVALLCCAGVGGFFGSAAPSVGMLICASLLIGMSAVLAPILIGLAREHLGPNRLSIAIGSISAAGSAGAGLVYLLTGIIVDHFGRRGGYMTTALLALTAAGLIAFGVPRSHRSKTRLSDIDFVRGILFGPAVAGMILAIELGAIDGWSNGVVPGLLLGSLLLAGYWWRNQLRQPRPLINLHLLSNGKALRGLVAMGLLGLGSQGGQVFALLLQQHHHAGAGFGMTATHSGLITGLINGTALFSSPLAGWLSKRRGARAIAILGACVIPVGWAICSFAFQSLDLLILGAFLFVTGVNLTTTPLYLLIVESIPADLTSGAAGLGNTLYNLAFAIGSQIVSVILMDGGGNGASSSASYQTTFAWLAGATMAIIPVLMIRRRGGALRQSKPSPQPTH